MVFKKNIIIILILLIISIFPLQAAERERKYRKKSLTNGDDVNKKERQKYRQGKYSEKDYPIILERIEGNKKVPDPNPILYRKPKGEGPFPVICFLPGGAGTTKEVTLKNFKDKFAFKPTKKEFFERGYMIAGIYVKSYGHGKEFHTTAPWEETVLAVSHLKKKEYIDPDSIVLFGTSGGGNVVLGTASLSQDFACIVVGEPATVIITGIFKSYADAKKAESSNSYQNPFKYYDEEGRKRTESAFKKINCPILIVQSDIHPINIINKLITIPTLQKLNKELEVKTYPGFKHGFYWQNKTPGMFDDINTFILKHIKVKPKRF